MGSRRKALLVVLDVRVGYLRFSNPASQVATGVSGSGVSRDPAKLALAVRLRQEMTLSVKEIAERLHLGKPKGARTRLHKFMNGTHDGVAQAQLDF
jgi:hypothetical protein